MPAATPERTSKSVMSERMNLRGIRLSKQSIAAVEGNNTNMMMEKKVSVGIEVEGERRTPCWFVLFTKAQCKERRVQ